MSNDAGVSVEYQTPEQVQRRAKQLPGMTFHNVLDSGICPEGANREYGRRAYKGGFENVDRLLKSPTRKRGRDLAIILSCLSSFDYSTEWRVVNSAEYGFPQRREHVFLYAEKGAPKRDLKNRVARGVMGKVLPICSPTSFSEVDVSDNPYEITRCFNLESGRSPFETAGVMQDGKALTCTVVENYQGPRRTLGDVLVPDAEVPEEYFVTEGQLEKWRYLKGASASAA